MYIHDCFVFALIICFLLLLHSSLWLACQFNVFLIDFFLFCFFLAINISHKVVTQCHYYKLTAGNKTSILLYCFIAHRFFLLLSILNPLVENSSTNVNHFITFISKKKCEAWTQCHRHITRLERKKNKSKKKIEAFDFHFEKKNSAT